MAKKKLKTQAAVVVAQSKDEVIEHIRQIGDLTRARERMEAEMNDAIAGLQEEYALQSAPLNDQIESLQNGIQVWCEANRDALTDGGKVKFADLITGIVRWRLNPPSVRVSGVSAVLALLKANEDLARFVRTKEEINKDAILNEKDKFADGQVPGIKITEGVEMFVIEPFSQELAQV